MSWPTVTLGDIAAIVSGGTPRTSERRFWGGEILWTTPKDLSDLESPYLHRPPRTITRDGLASCGASLLPVNSVLLSSRAPIGLVAINSTPMATNQGFKSLVPDKSRVDSKFLYYWLKSKTSFLQNLGNGATFKEISKAVVERIEIPLPPLDEQRRIATILDKADALYRKRKRALDLVNDLTQSIFFEMFFSGSNRPSNNETRALGDVCEIIRDGVHKTPTYVDSGIPFVTVKNIVSGSLDLTRTKFVSLDEHRSMTKRVCPEPGDILVSKDGTIGIPCLVPEGPPFSIFVSVALLRLKRSIVEPIFLAEQIKTDAVQRQIRENSKGIAIRHLHLSDFARLKIIVPPLTEQRSFSTKALSIGKARQAQSNSLRLAQALFCSLQHRAFSG